jgi:NAD(P)-dependent dehydrogenase (short-subunit alcohol dehydrogenase family)
VKPPDLATDMFVRIVVQCQAAVAEAINAFSKIDILFCCTSEAVVGTVEELAASPRTMTLVRDQFERNFFGPMNMIKEVLPQMRAKTNGHIIVLAGITGHLGTPGLGMYCAAGWALEGFCDSIAYEVAPFNIKLTIVQASIEIGILTNKVTSAPPMKAYSRETGNTAPLFRGILDGLLNRLPGIRAQYPQAPTEEVTSPSSEAERQSGPYLLSKDEVVSLYPPLSQAHTAKLVAETVHAVTAIGGHENPPARHIVGWEGVASVKEKLKTVSEELEEFVDTSLSADIEKPSTGHTRNRSSAEAESKDYDREVHMAGMAN